MHRNFTYSCSPYPKKEEVLPSWRYDYPSLSDNFSFEYSKLLNAAYSSKEALGSQTTKNPKTVAVIGAGISGTEAARELLRAGYNVHLYESSNRVGGRTYSVRARAPSTDDKVEDNAVAQLTSFEQGAMRIPFFNTKPPQVAGPGPYVGGPYTTDDPKTTDTANCTSMAEFWANYYKISTMAFPDPGKAAGPQITVEGKQESTYPGVATAVYVNSGYGVDLPSLYPTLASASKSCADSASGAPQIPDVTFAYDWPADSGDAKYWPQSDSGACETTIFYDRGAALEDLKPIPINLSHAIPLEASDHPPGKPPSTFKPGTPNYETNVQGWRWGVIALRTVSYKWNLFANAFLSAVGGHEYLVANSKGETTNVKFDGAQDWKSIQYDAGNAAWSKFWVEKVMPRYQNINFYEVAMAGPVLPVKNEDGSYSANPEWLEGNFGGLGMSGAEAQLFYTVGAGDGSWGAFFPQSALWALRALLFGFAQEHQLILGVLDVPQEKVAEMSPPADTSYFGGKRETIADSNGHQFWNPQYTGVNCFSECHFFTKATADGKSFYDIATEKEDPRARFYSSAKVTLIDRQPDGKINVTYNDVYEQPGSLGTPQNPQTYDFVLCTIPIWNTQTDMQLRNFGPSKLPMAVPSALKTSHWIRSAKVFINLNQPYWKQGPKDNRPGLLPQVLATNSELQDMYGLCASNGSNPWPTTGGIALISYTWEDDAQKFLAYQEKELAQMLLNRLNTVIENMGFKSPDSKPYFDQFMQDPTLESPASYTVWRWSLQPQYHGCAKAYQEGIENLNYALLNYNALHSNDSNLYFAGDSYSLESGWLEPALRMGLDASLYIINNDPNAKLTSAGGFTWSDYVDNTSQRVYTSLDAQVTHPLGPKAAPATKK